MTSNFNEMCAMTGPNHSIWVLLLWDRTRPCASPWRGPGPDLAEQQLDWY